MKDLKHNWRLKQEYNLTFSAPLFVTNNCFHLATLFVSYIIWILRYISSTWYVRFPSTFYVFYCHSVRLQGVLPSTGPNLSLDSTNSHICTAQQTYAQNTVSLFLVKITSLAGAKHWWKCSCLTADHAYVTLDEKPRKDLTLEQQFTSAEMQNLDNSATFTVLHYFAQERTHTRHHLPLKL